MDTFYLGQDKSMCTFLACVCVLVCFLDRPDMTFVVDWALKNNYLPILFS